MKKLDLTDKIEQLIKTEVKCRRKCFDHLAATGREDNMLVGFANGLLWAIQVLRGEAEGDPVEIDWEAHTKKS